MQLLLDIKSPWPLQQGFARRGESKCLRNECLRFSWEGMVLNTAPYTNRAKNKNGMFKPLQWQVLTQEENQNEPGISSTGKQGHSKANNGGVSAGQRNWLKRRAKLGII